MLVPYLHSAEELQLASQHMPVIMSILLRCIENLAGLDDDTGVSALHLSLCSVLRLPAGVDLRCRPRSTAGADRRCWLQVLIATFELLDDLLENPAPALAAHLNSILPALLKIAGECCSTV